MFTYYLLDEKESAIPRCGSEPTNRKIVYSNTSVHVMNSCGRRLYQLNRTCAYAVGLHFTAYSELYITNSTNTP